MHVAIMTYPPPNLRAVVERFFMVEHTFPTRAVPPNASVIEEVLSTSVEEVLHLDDSVLQPDPSTTATSSISRPPAAALEIISEIGPAHAPTSYEIIPMDIESIRPSDCTIEEEEEDYENEEAEEEEEEAKEEGPRQ